VGQVWWLRKSRSGQRIADRAAFLSFKAYSMDWIPGTGYKLINSFEYCPRNYRGKMKFLVVGYLKLPANLQGLTRPLFPEFRP
jgi:hypothetical protein